jgi:hypothetical protein
MLEGKDYRMKSSTLPITTMGWVVYVGVPGNDDEMRSIPFPLV